MRSYAIPVLQKKADVIEHGLPMATRWAGTVSVRDTGSVGGIRAKASVLVEKQIIFWQQEGNPAARAGGARYPTTSASRLVKVMGGASG